MNIPAKYLQALVIQYYLMEVVIFTLFGQALVHQVVQFNLTTLHYASSQTP